MRRLQPTLRRRIRRLPLPLRQGRRRHRHRRRLRLRRLLRLPARRDPREAATEALFQGAAAATIAKTCLGLLAGR